MNKYINLWKIVLILMFANQVIFAKITSGNISSGDQISLIPEKGHALSITRKVGFYGKSLFNFAILNGEDIIYEDKDQTDDIYLVFHDSVEEGDRVEIDVIEGKYQYEITNLGTLPAPVLEALKDTASVEVKEEKIEKKIEEPLPAIISEPIPIVEQVIEKQVEIIAPTKAKETPLIEENENIIVAEVPSFFKQISTVLGRLFGFANNRVSEIQKPNIEENILSDNIKPIEDLPKIIEPILEKENSSIAPKILSNDNQSVDKNYEVKLEKEAETMFLERRLSIPTPSYPDTGYKEIYKDIEKEVKKQEKIVIESKPLMEEITPIVEAKIEPKKLENIPFKDELKEEEPQFAEEKIIITKIIDKDNSTNIADDAFSSIDDRVLGNGYKERENGELGMKVYKNSRPVTAWIEVFKSGTRDRVKTFYTKKGSIPKSIKLPAGTYMVKATYRSPNAKQQKSLKNVVIEEGQSVNRKIAFYDGTLKVKVTKGGIPSYSKVVAYKTGSRKIVSYAFSNKSSGSCSLILENGRYDLEVSNYRDKKSISGISIQSGKTKNIKVEF